MSNVLVPLEAPFPAEVAETLAQYPQQGGYLLSLFRTFANSVRFLKKGVPNLLDKESPLPLTIREIVILRITANNACEYEWGVHVAVFQKAAKLSDEQIAATRAAGADAACWNARQRRLINAIDELCAEGTLGDPTLARFQEDWTLDEQLEILALCGAYHTISFVANVARLPGEAFAATFPG
ncbi:MAG TPA: carboxymuconolactone decarboxylase family protein [Polyangia bacterium]|nr:carboxymuconolactone decarboxylase family protein [Polyangia bacterium]